VPAIVVAALSARLLAQATVEAGLDVMALDVFGDADTCAAATHWLPIGTPQALRIDSRLFLETLEALARQERVQGWVAGAGFEGRPELLEQGSALLPLFGTPGADVRRVRDPKTFFDALGALRITHPEVRLDADTSRAGWLVKDFAASGGTHIRRADSLAPAALTALTALQYWQREVHGTAMSATFIGDGHHAAVLGCNEQIVQPFGASPYRFHGVVGPVAVADAVRREVDRIVAVLTEAFALRGLASLDFMLVEGAVHVLEVNPRPPASMALYAHVGAGGAMRAHLNACRDRALPGAAAPQNRVCGTEIVFADRPLRLDAAAATALANAAHIHDVPRAANAAQHETHLRHGDPLCSVSASGADAASVRSQLARRRDALLQMLETLQPGNRS
jgi:predicted ATP-grasp superfamily ATP-dependent carboligase